MVRWLKSAVFFFTVFCVMPVFSAQFPAVPNPFHYVNDYTNTLSAKDKATLEAKLIDYAQQTSSQIAVVMIPSTEEYDISQYAFELGDKWGVGRKQLNNGVLMLIAKQDRNMFIAVGQGLEGVLPDAFLSQLIRHQITPHFKQGDYAQGISLGLDYLIAASKGEFDTNQAIEDTWEDYIPVLMVVIFILFVWFGNWRAVPYISPTSARSRRGRFPPGGGGFGGFGGGGSGGGFGGGSFGGGGAGGSW
ncbi:TPM domain-containing protein [Pasteurella sp. PK-2025]|uniref:TPM domain-containing protein n=1 Tax=unclassified Pasteurella TaxID=2621516 RepID=UPI003C788D7F